MPVRSHEPAHPSTAARSDHEVPTGLLDAAGAVDLAAQLDLARDLLVTAFGDATRPFSGKSVADLEERVGRVDLDEPLSGTQEALTELREVYLDHAVWFHHPLYQAHLNCPVVVPSVVGELIASAVNTSMDTWDQSGTATLMEQHLLRWVGARLGFGEAADGVFTSGGTQSNLHGLLLAREAARRDDVDEDRWCVVVSDVAHFSARRSAHLLGIHPRGRAGDVLEVATDRQGRMRPDSLERVLRAAGMRGLRPVAVVATAGTTDHGAVDPLGAVADLAEEHGAWLHVDAAYGGGLLVSPTRRHLLDGIERADSVTVDFHKTWFQPVACSALVVRDRETLVRHHAEYLNPEPQPGSDEPAAHPREDAAVPNLVDHSLQTTRRFDALKLWVTLRTLGPDHLGRMLDQCCDLARRTRTQLLDDVDFDVVDGTDLSTVLFRFVACPTELQDQVNDGARGELVADGAVGVARTRIGDRTWLKLTLLDPTTTLADTNRVVGLVRDAAARLAARLAAEQPDQPGARPDVRIATGTEGGR